MHGILIGTAILWVLNLAIVSPLATGALRRRMVREGVDPDSDLALSEEEQAYWSGVATKQYILHDVLVLGTAGLIGGLLGYYFVGLTLDAKGWPGMIAFIASSFIGVGIRF